jgi:hypothetical protein
MLGSAAGPNGVCTSVIATFHDTTQLLRFGAVVVITVSGIVLSLQLLAGGAEPGDV